MRPCPVCRGTSIAGVVEVDGRRDVSGAPLRLATCADCSLVFQPQTPSHEDLVRWYDYMGHHPEIATVSPLLVRRLMRTLDVLEPFRTTGRILEVGCGGGMLLKLAEQRGWVAHGIEISPSCGALLRPWLGERFHAGDLSTAPFPAASFDAVVMIELIEHLPEPADYLRAAHRWLRPGGCLRLTTPNFRGVNGRLQGTRWRVITDEHLSYFDRETLRRLLDQTGFSHADIASTGLDLSPLFYRLRKRFERRRTAPVTTITPPQPPGETNSVRTWAADHMIEMTNSMLSMLHLGDTLKALAFKPQ